MQISRCGRIYLVSGIDISPGVFFECDSLICVLGWGGIDE